VLLMLAALAAYIGVLPVLGFLPATALFVLVVVRALGEYSWAMTATWTVVIAGAGHVVFKHWLGMPLPAGPLGF
jgi:putative tricarboxylic transport membrane protein